MKTLLIAIGLLTTLTAHADYETLARERAAREAAEEPARQASARARYIALQQLKLRNSVAHFTSRHCGLESGPSAARSVDHYTEVRDLTTRDGFECQVKNEVEFTCVQRGTLKTEYYYPPIDLFEKFLSPNYRAPRVLCPGPGFNVSNR